MSQDEDLPTQDLEKTLERPAPRDMKGRAIGPYRLLQRIGEGGMGEVWLASQEVPRRQVAVKLIKRGMDTESVIARFEAERQALAVMDHPCIAKVFDAGETDDGRPWFVMEYVKGEPLTDYCDRRRLSTRERLELFLEVCRGVQHAHQKAVIHRDLKPSNILVAEHDDRSVPKIIDFGIAKAMGRELTERTLFTELGQVLGTPEYMAPEQAEMFDADIDIRTDVYALGVVLYELLAGALPFDSKDLRRAGLADIHRKIREEEPPRPSTRVSTLGETVSRVAELRRTDAGSLVKRLRGDLDWITMKALEKDRARRYDTANELLRDVERHLHDEPVVARPPELTYRVNKFVRRHRAGVVAAALVVASLIAGLSVATWQAIEARRAQRMAQEQAERADRQALTSNRVSEFLLSLFRTANPYGEESGLTIEQVLDQGLAEIDQLDAEPLVQSDLLLVLGDAMMATGRRDRGLELIERSVALREGALEADDPDLLYHRWFEANRQETGIDEEWRRRAIAAFDALADRSDAIGRYRRAELQSALGSAAQQLDDDLEASTALLSAALESLEQLGRETGQFLRETPGVMEYLGFIAILQGDLNTAEGWYGRAVNYTRDAVGERHVRYAQSLGQYATVLRDLERHEEAVRAANDAYEIRLAAVGTETENVVYDLGIVVSVHREQGKLEKAETAAREMLAMARRIDSVQIPRATCLLADVLVARRSLDEAQQRLEEAEALEAGQEFDCRRARGMLLLQTGDVATGEALLVETWEALRHRDLVHVALRTLAREAESAHRQAGRGAESTAWTERAAGL